jgi:hypothetical protein
VISRVVHRRWAAVLIVMIGLRSSTGPLMFGIQRLTDAYERGGSCGNAQFPIPNSDPISWWASRGHSAPYQRACAAHDDCYDRLDITKSACDWAFWREMREGCATLHIESGMGFIGRIGCHLQVESYFLAVSALPHAQRSYCRGQRYAWGRSIDNQGDSFNPPKNCQD